MEKDKKIFTMREVANLSRCTVSAVSALTKKKRLKAYKDEGRWMIRKEDLEYCLKTKYSRQYSMHEGKPKFDKSKGEYSVPESANILKITEQTLYYYLRTRRLPFKKKGASYVLKIEDVKAFGEELEESKKLKLSI